MVRDYLHQRLQESRTARRIRVVHDRGLYLRDKALHRWRRAWLRALLPPGMREAKRALLLVKDYAAWVCPDDGTIEVVNFSSKKVTLSMSFSSDLNMPYVDYDLGMLTDWFVDLSEDEYDA